MTQRAPLVTVVTASFNALDALRKTVESVAGQRCEASVEHVIVDGGSNDGTREYLESLPANVRWISEKDDGIGHALNKGIAMAQGEYIVVLQAGDVFLGDQAVARASQVMADGADIVSFAVKITCDGPDRIFYGRGLGLGSEFFMTVPHQGAFCRRNLYARIGVFDVGYKVAMDYDFMLRAKAAGASICVVDEPISVMPADGVSARLDWKSLSARLAENRAIQKRHGKGGAFALLRAIFWIVYPPIKRVMAQRRARDRSRLVPSG